MLLQSGNATNVTVDGGATVGKGDRWLTVGCGDTVLINNQISLRLSPTTARVPCATGVSAECHSQVKVTSWTGFANLCCIAPAAAAAAARRKCLLVPRLEPR